MKYGLIERNFICINEALQDLTLGQDHDVEESKEQIATLDWSLAESVIS